MDSRNETALRNYQFLNETYFAKLYEAFLQAFSDYVVPFALTEAQFRNHIILNAVDLNSTIGCVEGDKLIGFSLNGFGEWNGKSTVYDAGTGVIPEFRQQGVSEKMFDLMLPVFKEKGIEQCLLEVVTNNTPAVALYEKLGFYKIRELALLQCEGKLKARELERSDIEIRPIQDLDWNLFRTFWDGGPSWQNSVEAIARSRKVKTALGAFIDGKCAGYVIFSANFGRVAQLAVDREHRHLGIAAALLQSMQSETDAKHPAQVINIDKSLTDSMNFFHRLGFNEILSQFEMIKAL
jgi:ribosomal protein S18 acetylase RimI-like enzyme